MLLEEASPELKEDKERRLNRMADILEKEQDRVYVVSAQDRPHGGLRKRKHGPDS